MFLIETNLFEVTRRQYNFKLKAYFDLFVSLIMFQVIGILFSLGGTSSQGMNYITITNYSSSIVMILTFMILFSLAIVIQTANYKRFAAVIVKNSYSSSFSDIAFIITICIFGGITASLSSVVFRVLFYFIKSSENIINNGFFISPEIMLISITSITLYAVLISSVGYLVGILVQFNKAFAILLPAVSVGVIFLRRANQVIFNITIEIYNFYCTEASLFIFAIKIIISALIFFSVSVLLRNNLELK